jgi:hypothetical protein
VGNVYSIDRANGELEIVRLPLEDPVVVALGPDADREKPRMRGQLHKGVVEK